MTAPVNPASTPDPRRLMAELQFLSELTRVMASTTELQPILDWIVEKTRVMLGADEGSIRLLGPDESQPSLQTIVRKQSAGIASGSWPQTVSMSAMGYLYRADALDSSDLHDDPRFPGLRGNPTRIRAVLAVPLKVENRITGMLAVTETRPGRIWTENEILLLGIVASHSAGAIEQARLRVEAIRHKEIEERNRRTEEELARARETQMTLVPSETLAVGPWCASGRIVPARQVGGDAFDYFPIGERRFAVAIADVSGKGVPAALLMSNVVASLRAFCNGREPIPHAIGHVNHSFTRTVATGKFITLFYGEVDYVAGRLSFVNAGHNPPFLRRTDGTVVRLSEGGVPVGIFESWDYVQGEVSFAPGDSLLLYSDGVTEALDGIGTEYGEERLERLWKADGARPPADVIERVLADLAEFRGRAEQSDDITLVVVGAGG
jgi:serine phosphatase RsbU (regulator of sigma subunit)